LFFLRTITIIQTNYKHDFLNALSKIKNKTKNLQEIKWNKMHLLERDKSKLETNFSKLIALHLTCIKKGGGEDTKHIIVMMDWAQSNSNKPRMKGHG
jgi:hypothetical protein